MEKFEHKLSPEKLGRILILGKGVTGSAVKTYLDSNDPARIDCVDEVTEDELDTSKSYDLCIASPGISEFSDFYLKAKEISKEVISEVEFAFRESEKDSKWIAITGTNGKTTTTALTAHLLNSAGIFAVAVGNIGDTCISRVDGKAKVYVAECSSYQLASTKDFAPNAAAILNITPDHIKWHQGLENYAKAKFKVFENIKDDKDKLVYLGSDVECNFGFGCTFETEKTSPVRELVEGMANDLQIKGEHNVLNAICAATLANFIGESVEDIKKALVTFAPLEHRIEPCGEVNGVKFFNDSKATNVDSTIKALSAFPQGNVFLLVGGRDKMSDLKPLVDECYLEVNGITRVKKVICFGEAAERFYDAFAGHDESICKTLKDAFELAKSEAGAGDSILLSPACASFDEFSGFEERGRYFKDLVKNAN